ncbi:MAG: hypothetical protein GY863_00155 [bacterium]|nr:hypothetical protein [bacterium]
MEGKLLKILMIMVLLIAVVDILELDYLNAVIDSLIGVFLFIQIQKNRGKDLKLVRNFLIFITVALIIGKQF